jgi:hypothetical protein
MTTNFTIDLPDDLEAAIGDRDLSLKQQFLLEYLYEHDIRSVEERCDRKDLDDQLDFSEYQSKKATRPLAEAGLITIKNFSSEEYYMLDIPSSSGRHHHYHQLIDHPTPPTNSTSGQRIPPTTTALTTPPPTEPQTTTPKEPSTTSPAVPSNTTNSASESPEQGAKPDPENEQHQTTHDPARSSLTDSHKTAPPEPLLFATATAAITGLLHYLSNLPQELTLSTVILLNIMYTSAFALAIRDITPNQLSSTVISSMP